MSTLGASLDENLFPEAIVNHLASGLLELRWQDGSESRLAHGLLRARCRCAGCQQLYRQSGKHPEVISTIRLEAINPISDKGLNLVFSDGHGRGIFPWAYLHELSAVATSATNIP